MKKDKKGRSPKKMKCAWCGKMVEIHKGRIRSHLRGSEQCVGVGQTTTFMEAANARVEKYRKA